MGKKKKAKARAKAATNKTFLPDVIYVSDVLTSAGQQVGWQISKHNIPDIWLQTQGEGITVAVLDTGADVHHPDLSRAISRAWDIFVRKERSLDRNGHGTHCTGIITANNNDIGMVGVSPKSKTMAIKVLGDDGSGTMAGVAAGIRFAIQNKADIISMSLGGPEGDPDLHAAIKEAYNLNIPIVCAAGNSGDRGVVAYPARYPETIAIGALNSQNLRAEFSQTGTKLDFMAPGVNVFSTYIGAGYRVLSGTSMATPWVAGVVALMMAKHRKIGGKTPLRSVEDVREHLRKTTIDLDQAGKDPKTGYGLIDVSKALEALEPEPISEPTPTPEPDPTPRLDPRIDQLEQTINDLVVKVEALTGRITGLESKLNQINDLVIKVEALTGRITGLESKLNQIKAIL